jgi:D-alanyl-D-alanine dipeptidase
MPSSLRDLDYEIPILDPGRFKGGYGTIPVDRSDPRFDEPLVRLESVGVAYGSYYARSDGLNPPFHRPISGSREDMWVRRSLAEKLAAVNQRLHPYGAELFVLDGYRTVECQQGLWSFYYDEAGRQSPDASEDQRRRFARQFIRDPSRFDRDDPTTWFPHTTGAAVDLTLRDAASGELLDMGSRFEEIADDSVTDYFERQLLRGLIGEDDARLRHRRLLHWAMTGEGLHNETSRVYRHTDWGDQLYVRACRGLFREAPSAAWYGYIEPP